MIDVGRRWADLVPAEVPMDDLRLVVIPDVCVAVDMCGREPPEADEPKPDCARCRPPQGMADHRGQYNRTETRR